MESEDTTLRASSRLSGSQSSHSATAKTARTCQIWTATFSVAGMTCATCTNSIQDAISKMPAIRTVRVELMSNSATVVYEGLKTYTDSILEEIEAVGFDATLSDMHQTDTNEGALIKTVSERMVQIQLESLSNENSIERVVNLLNTEFGDALEVITKPTLKAPVLTVRYTPLLPHRSIRCIISTIEGAGKSFKPSVYHPPTVEQRSRESQQHERKRILRRLVLTLGAVVPSFIIGIVIMMLLPNSHPARERFMRPLWPGNAPLGEWIMLVFATVIFLFAADLFHRRALKELYFLWRPGSREPILRRFYRFGSMNLLISAGTSVAYISSVAVFILQATGNGTGTTNSTYFDSVIFLTFFLLLGRFLEVFTKSKTSDAISVLGKLRPETAKLVLAGEDSVIPTNNFQQPNKTEMIPIDHLEVGDNVIVAQGSSPPSDGIIVQGEGKFDESSLTGESKPVPKRIGETVYLGTINVGNPITVRITEIGGSSMLDQIVQVVREGLSKHAPIERLADVLTAYFVPIITLLAIITFVTWVTLGYSGALPKSYVEGQAGGWAFYSLGFAISVFVAACPCGIGLAAPTALFVGIGLAAKHGILVRGGGEAFQDAPHVDAVVFDKTGTLTEGGDLKVTSHEFLNGTDAELAAGTASQLEDQSSHPIARAIAGFLSDCPMATVEASNIEEEAGYGMRGTFSHQGMTYTAVIGSDAFINRISPGLIDNHPSALSTLSTWQTQAQSVAILAAQKSSEDGDWQLLALFGTSDPVRPSAARTIQELNRQKIPVYMLSGDNPRTAQAVAATLGIHSGHIFAGVLPTEKAERIHALRREYASKRLKHRTFFTSSPGWLNSDVLSLSSNADEPETHQRDEEVGVGAGTPDSSSATTIVSPTRKSPSSSSAARIAFVGDGINDAPALLASDVGIAMGTGAPVAITAASFVLLRPNLDRIPLLFRLSRRVMRRVALNYGWAIVYNAVLVPVAAGALWRVRSDGFVLGPAWAALAMAGSSLSVMLSSLALKWESPRWGRKEEQEEEQEEQ